MVDTCDPTICCWSEDGTHFIVKDAKKFETEIIPQYFGTLKIQSYYRQLNLYSFKKTRIFAESLPNSTPFKFRRFYHPNFQHGRLDLLKEIKREKRGTRSPDENINASTGKNKVNKTGICTSTICKSSSDDDQKSELSVSTSSEKPRIGKSASNNSSSNDIKSKTIRSEICDNTSFLADAEIPIFIRSK